MRTGVCCCARVVAKHGYDDTTTEAIAERAGVSPPFSSAAATKESVLFVGEYDWLQSFTADFAKQPHTLSDIGAIRTTLVNHPAPRSGGAQVL
jgi:hypothetical protein